MNLLDNGWSRKKGIIVGSSLIFILVVVLIIVFKDNIMEIINPNEDLKEEQIYTDNLGGGGAKNPRDYGEARTDKTKVKVITPTETTKGVVKGYIDNGASSELEVETKEGVMSFRLNTSVIVFDSASNTLKLPSELKNAKKIQVLSVLDTGETPVAEVVILDAKEDITYTPVMSVSKTDEAYYLTNDSIKTQYKIGNNIKITNMLSGQPYDIRELKPGDRIFSYSEGEPVKTDKPIMDEDDEYSFMPHPDDIDDYLGITDEHAEPVRESELPSDYETIKSTEIYVYPYN